MKTAKRVRFPLLDRAIVAYAVQAQTMPSRLPRSAWRRHWRLPSASSLVVCIYIDWGNLTYSRAANDDDDKSTDCGSEPGEGDVAVDDGTRPDLDAAIPEKPAPGSFSQIDTKLPKKQLDASFPRFAEAVKLTCEVRAGQMLYLPAGWFHEVTSFSDGKDASHHMALNFWFHPPTKFGPESTEYPYDSSFWARDWAARGLDPDLESTHSEEEEVDDDDEVEGEDYGDEASESGEDDAGLDPFIPKRPRK